MLTRRILRIRVIQDLYTYFINKRAADSHLKDNLLVLGNVDKKQDKRENNIYGDTFVEDYKTTCDAEKNFFDTIHILNNNLHNGLKQHETHMYNNYYNIIYLLVEWLNVAKTQLSAIKAYKKYYKVHDVAIFTNNKILNNIADSDFFKLKVPEKILFSENDMKTWYNTYIKKDKFFIKYCSSDTQITDFEIIKYIIKNRILDNGSINIFFAENDPLWENTIFIVKKMLLKTIKFFRDQTEKDTQSQNHFPEIVVVDKSEEDFYKNLVTSIEKNWKRIIDLILPKLQNWDLERIFLIDKIIMAMAINEINFLNIPASIAINEYIEIAKIYSTSKSSKFINGIVNKIFIEKDYTGSI